MSINYKVVKQVFGFDKTGSAKYVVRTVTGEMLTFEKVPERCSCNSRSSTGCGLYGR